MPRRLVAVLVFVCGGFMAIAGQPPTTWYVDDDGDEANGCTSWADACPELQTALLLANSGDQIWVAQGLYRPDYDVDADQHTGDRAATFRLMSGVALYGGFEGTETVFEERAGLFDLTVLTGDLNGDDQPEFQNNGENGYHVVTGGGADETALLDGFLITAGNADASFPDNVGAGVANVLGSPSITNCILYGNSAQHGGGMFNGPLGSPIVTRCLFLENAASGWGGGVNNFISGNPLLIECTMRGNRAQRGGALSNFFQTNAIMINCVFVDNSAEASGGAVHSSQTDPTFINCMFSANHSKGNGGAVYSLSDSNTSIINCTFKGNGALAGGAIYTTDEFGGTFHSTAEVSNCIAHGNDPDEIASVAGATTVVRFSNVEGGFIGDGNIDADPLFVDPEGDEANLRLLAGSPCIDAADNAAVPEGIVIDLDGNPRFVDDPNTDDTGFGDPPIVDMGAYEFRDPCADDDGDGRVTICHIPPGNPNNARTMAVSVNAVPSHLAHGDHCGPCAP